MNSNFLQSLIYNPQIKHLFVDCIQKPLYCHVENSRDPDQLLIGAFAEITNSL